MSTDLSNGVIIPEEYSDDWYDEMSINLRKLNDVITAASDNATDIQRLDTDKANQSDLTALTSRVSQNETDITALQTAVSGALKREIVQTLPTEDISTTTIYMIRNSQSSGTNIYDEYMYINNLWELIGTSATDFSNYYTKTEIDTLLSYKATDSDVVHKSGNETISGKTFLSNVNVYNSNPTATTPNLNLRSSKVEISSQGNTSGEQNLVYLDKNNTTYAYVKGAIQSNGSVVKIRAIAKDSSDNSVVNELQLLANTNGNKAIFPLYSNEVDLGVSNYKWKSFNGVEPSSLSLPDLNNGIDISSYITHLDKVVNQYTPPSNGWLSIRVRKASLTHTSLMMSQTGGLLSSCETAEFSISGIILPVIANKNVDIYIIANSLESAKFYPCRGNV